MLYCIYDSSLIAAVDVLIRRKDWKALRKTSITGLKIGLDHAVDTETEVEIDVIFPGDDWEMVIPVPDPHWMKEYDREVGAFFYRPSALLLGYGKKDQSQRHNAEGLCV